jgi:uncharacterized protein (TIGR00162 family)
MMMVKKGKKPKLRNPVLIEGLPGIGNVAKIAVDFMVKEMDAKEYYTIHSEDLPHSIFVSEESLVTLPSLKLFYSKAKKRDVVFLVGDTQASSESGTYRLASQILEISEEMGIREVITLGGIGHRRIPKTVKLHAVATNKKVLSKLKGMGLCVDPSCVSVVIGFAGLLVGLAEKKDMEGFSLLADTYAHPAYLGAKGAKKIVDFLSKYLGIDVDTRKMREFIMVDEPLRKPIKKKDKEVGHVSYIG